jgi:hypothetical protein
VLFVADVHCGDDSPGQDGYVTKLLSAFVILAMIVQIIKPIGLPGLTKRSDFWKLPLAGFVVIMIVTALQA